MNFQDLNLIEYRVVIPLVTVFGFKFLTKNESYIAEYIRASFINFNYHKEEKRSITEWGEFITNELPSDLVAQLKEIKRHEALTSVDWTGTNWKELHSSCNFIGNFQGHQVSMYAFNKLPQVSSELTRAVREYNSALIKLREAAREQSKFYVEARKLYLARKPEIIINKDTQI